MQPGGYYIMYDLNFKELLGENFTVLTLRFYVQNSKNGRYLEQISLFLNNHADFHRKRK